MNTTGPHKTRTILVTLLIGFLSGATAASYVLLRYGYLIDFQRTSQTSQDWRPIPERIPRAPSEKQRAGLDENQAPQTLPAAEAQAQEADGRYQPILEKMEQTQTQQLSAETPNPTPISEDQEDREPPGVLSVPGFEPPDTNALAVNELRQRNLLLPLSGLKREDLADSYSDMRVDHVHEAIDILAPRHTPVLAVENGSIARLWNSVHGGITIYQFDPQKKYEYYYAHLDRCADGLKEGDDVRRGQVIGYVGSSGNASASAPHLHFTIFRLTESKHWWEGTPVNPYLVFR